MFHSTGERNSLATALAGDYNAGSVRVLTGSAPTDADQAETGTLLVSVTLPNPAYGAAAAGVITLNGTPLTGSIVATGTAGYVRQVASGDTGALSTTQKRLQGAVGTSAAELIVNTTAFVSGGTFTLNGNTWTAPT